MLQKRRDGAASVGLPVLVWLWVAVMCLVIAAVAVRIRSRAAADESLRTSRASRRRYAHGLRDLSLSGRRFRRSSSLPANVRPSLKFRLYARTDGYLKRLVFRYRRPCASRASFWPKLIPSEVDQQLAQAQRRFEERPGQSRTGAHDRPSAVRIFSKSTPFPSRRPIRR